MGEQPHPPEARASAGQVLRGDARFGLAFLRRHGGRLLLLFLGVLLPLWAFAELAADLGRATMPGLDAPLLALAGELRGHGLDGVFLAVSALGYAWGVIPADVILIACLAWRQRLREGLFAGVAIGGSALLNIAAKLHFARERPTPWHALAAEHSYSFPSAHAMGSMTLAAVLVLLAWPTRWRWPVLLAMAVFVPLVGLSRVYLGVHYPSDVLAGWAAATAWVAGCHGVIIRGGPRVHGMPGPTPSRR